MVFSCVVHRIEEEERVDFFIQVLEWQGEPVNTEPDKCDELRWAHVDELPETVIPYVRQAIECHRLGIAFLEFGWQ